MNFRWKLTLVMLVVSILPIVILRTFGIHNVQAMADALANEVQANRLAMAQNDIQSALKGFGEGLNLERERIATALFFLADFVRQAQRQRAAEDQHLSLAYGPQQPPTNDAPPLSHLCVRVPNSEIDRQDVRRLVPIESTFSAISEHLGDLILGQHAALVSGVAASYPCNQPGLRFADVTAEEWHRNALRESVYSWSRPYRKGPSGRWATSVSLLLEDDNDRPSGVVSIEVALDRLLERTLSFVHLPDRARAMLGMLEKQPASGEIGLKILLEYPSTAQAEPGYLNAPESNYRQTMVKDIARRASQIVRMPFEGQDAYWAYAPLPCQGTALVVIIPSIDLLQAAQPVQAAIQERLHKVEILTGGFLILLAAVNAVLVFVFSRMVTRPLEALSTAAKRLATGDFDTRVTIVSRDEFGAMGEVFNGVGPQLKEHYRDREALQAAVEIQQNLLPQAAPHVPGLDIHALSLYSEHVGGDYYDYLCVGEGGPQRLCAAVGDVSGHGIPAAITMATARAFLRLRASLPGTLGDIITDVNRKLVEDVEYSGQFMTLFLLRIDRGAGQIQWVRAGQDPGLLYDSDRETFRELAGVGAPLGLSVQTRFVESSATIEPGQIIVIGTDGIWETRNGAGEMFGKARLMELIRRHVEAGAQALVLAVLDAVEEFRDPNDPADDMTLMVIKVN